jgi:hypothetical protein
MKPTLVPCDTCPWRIDNDATVIPLYNQELAAKLLNTVGEGDALRPIMACHYADRQHPRACRGYLARHGWSNLNVRRLLLSRRIANPDDVRAACAHHGVALEPDYPTVLDKLRQSWERLLRKRD